MPTLERIARRSEARESEPRNGTAPAFRGPREEFSPLPGNQALRRLIEKKKRRQETRREVEPETPYEIVVRMEEHLENDPGDASGRMRSQLEALQPEKRQEVLALLQERASTAGLKRLTQVLGEPAPRTVEAPAGRPEGEQQAAEAEQEQARETEESEARRAEPPAPPAEPEPERPEREAERARRVDEREREQRPLVREAEDESERAATVRQTAERAAEAAPAETPEAALARTQRPPEAGGRGPEAPGRRPEDVLRPAPEVETERRPQEQAVAPGAAGQKTAPLTRPEARREEARPTEAPPPEAGAARPAAEARPGEPAAGKPAPAPAAGAVEPGQAQQSEALKGLPAPARGEAGAAPPAPSGPAARQTAAQPAPAAGGAPAAEAGGGDDGGEAALQAEPEEGAAAAEGEQAAEKMDKAEPTAEAEEGPAEPEPPEAGVEAEGPLSSAEAEEARAAGEEEQQQAARGGTPEPAAGEEEAEEGAAAPQAEVPGAEREAGLASLAEGGGGEPAGGGGGGGGGAITEEAEPEPPDVSTAEPAAAMSSLSGLKVGAIAQAMGSVSTAISTSVGSQRQELAANPPTMERPSGSPVTRDGPISDEYREEGGGGEAAAVQPVLEGEAVEVPEPEPVPEPGPDPTEAVEAPPVTGGEGGEITEEDAENVQSAVRDMPTSDPELQTAAGPAPTLELQGDADPQQARDQRAELDQTAAEQQAQGAQDVAQPMGEDEVYPTVPQETLEGQVPAGGGGGEAGGEAAAADDETAAIIAEEKEGDSVRSSVQQASADMAAKQQEHAEEEAAKRSETDAEIAATVAENTSLQAEERQAAKSKTAQLRNQWNEGQRQAVGKAQTDADAEAEKLETGVAGQQEQANAKAQEEVDTGSRTAEEERRSGEARAESEKQKAEGESSGIFGWLASKAKAFFSALKKAVSAAISAMRKAVKAAIEAAKKAAFAVIDMARNAVVGLIRMAGEALMAIGDVLLAAFPELREKFRKMIREGVAAAEDAVNRYADELKKNVAAALDALGSALDALLGLLEKGLLAVLDAANSVVQAAIKAAQAVVAALAAFAVIIKDIASGPLQWIRNLGAAVVDGIRNHLWKAFKAAIKAWFEQKLTELLGVGMMIFQILMKGGIKIAEVGKMAFEGLKAAIPAALVAILVEKLVAMIVPAAGAIMAIIEGLQAAWGTISRILAAIGKFISFLKAVKSGNAGPQFADMLAAAAIAVIDFVANWLIRRLRGPASKIGNKVKAIAKNILEKLKKVARKVVGAVKRGLAKIKTKIKKLFKRKKKKSRKKEKSDRDKAQKRLDKAVRELRPRIQSLVRAGASKHRLRAMTLLWRLRYRLTQLALQQHGQRLSVIATVNPTAPVITDVVSALQAYLMHVIRDVANQLMLEPQVRHGMERMAEQRAEGRGTAGQQPIETPIVPSMSLDIRSQQRAAARREARVIGAEESAVSFSLFMGKGATAGNVRVQAAGIGRGAYSDIVANIPPGVSGGQLATFIQEFERTGRIGAGAPAGTLRVVAGISAIGAVEGARDPTDLIRRVMLLEAARTGHMTPQQLIEASPMVPTGSSRVAHEVAAGAAPDLPVQGGYTTPVPARRRAGMPGEIQRFIEQEKQVMVMWLFSTMSSTDPLFTTEEELRRNIRRHLWDYLRSHVRGAFGM